MRSAVLLGLFLYSSTSIANTVEVANNVPDFSGSIVTMSIGLIFIVGLIYTLLWLSKKAGLNRYANNELKVTNSLSLTPKEKLIVVEYGNKKLLLGVSSGSVNCIDQQEIVKNANDILEKNSFTDKLMNAIKQSSAKAD